jgi:hypothetical protein
VELSVPFPFEGDTTMDILLIGLGVYLILAGLLVRFLQVVRQRDAFMQEAHEHWMEAQDQARAREAS